jgi:aryl-alcohol dehydrogenase-like predicted oxidoreductase
VSPIVGVTTPGQISEAMAARDLTLTAAQRDRLDSPW